MKPHYRKRSSKDSRRNRKARAESLFGKSLVNQYGLRLEPLEDRRMLAFTATLAGSTATFVGDGAADTLTFDVSGGNLRHNRFTAGDAGFESDLDFDSTVAGVQTLSANVASIVNMDTGAGADTVNIGTNSIAASSLLATFNYNLGGAGDTLVIDDGASATGKTYSVGSVTTSATGISVTVLTTVTGGKTVRTSSGNDTVNVLTTAASEALLIDSTNGTDTVNVGNVNGVQNIIASVSISNTLGTSAVTLDNTGDNTNHAVAVSDTGVTGLAPAAINISSADVSSLTVIGGAGQETFTVTPTSVGTLAFDIQGAAPSSVPGDVLSVNLAGVTGAALTATSGDAGSFAFTNRTSFAYSQIERVISGGTGTFTVGAINTGAGNDTINLARSGGDMVLSVGGSVRLRADLASIAGGLVINGEGGDDAFTVDFAGGNPIPAGDVTFNGGAGGNDSMVLTGGSVDTLRHFFTNANDGSAEFDGDTTDNGGAAETKVLYTGLDPITDNMNVANRVFTFNNGNDVATLGDDPFAGNNMLRISTTNVTSETVDFTTPTATLTVNLDNGGTGDDTLTISAFDSLSSISTSITINAGAGADTITSNLAGPGGLVPNVNLNGEDGIDEIRVWAVPAQGALASLINTNVNTGIGSPGDRTIVGSGATFANYNTGVGTLASILGNVNIADYGTIGEAYIDNSGDATGRTFNFVGTGAVPVFGGPGLVLTSPLLPGSISATDEMNVYRFAAGSGADTLTIANSLDGFAAGNTVANTFFGNGGDDTFNIVGDGLADNNTFLGGDGNDNFDLDIAVNIGASTNGINSLLIEGNAGTGGAPNDSANRDRLIINDSAATVRSLDYQYLTQASGDVNIVPSVVGGGLFGAANLNLQVRTMETLVFNDISGTNNDSIRVTGTASSDILTVGLLPTLPANSVLQNGTSADNSAVVFLGGNPYLDAPPVTVQGSEPGVAGGSFGPDLVLNGISAAGGAGLTVAGGGVPGGDRLVVYAASESNLTEAGNASDVFGFGAGVLLPGFGVGDAYDTINVSDSLVTTTNNSEGSLVRVIPVTASFVQAGPPAGQSAGLTVNGGDEALPQANDRADVFNATLSSNFHIQVNGNLPNLTNGVNGQPQGDELNLTITGAINVYSDASNPPNVTITGVPAISGPFGVKFSSIERTFLTPGNGIVNLIGDNNNAAGPAQNDVFVVRGMDVDFNPNIPTNGQNEFSLQIGGDKVVPGGPVSLSSPIFFRGVTRINASGGEAVAFDGNGNAIPATVGTGIDTLDITPYADNTPRGWGIETFFNEGDPILDGDLLIFNGVLGVSDGIVVQPSALEGGQVFSNNRATNTPIAVVNYVLNTAIIVNGNNGLAGDTDTLTLRGLNPDPNNPGVSGYDHVTANFTAAGDAANPLVTFRDLTAVGPIVYELQNFSGLNTINFELLAGADTMLLTGRDDGSLTVNIDGGNDALADTVTFQGTFGADDSYLVQQGSANNAASVLIDRATAMAPTAVNITRLESLNFDGLGGVGSDVLTVYGTDASNIFTVQSLTALSGLIGVDNFPNLFYNNFGTGAGGGFSTINLMGDAFGGAAQSGLDSVRFAGTPSADAYTYTPSASDAGTMRLVSAGSTIDFSVAKFEAASLNAGDPTVAVGDTLTVPVTSALIVPGSTSGSGTVTALNAGGQGLLPLGFSNLESSTVTGGTVVVDGSQYDDRIAVSAAGVVTVADHNGVVINTFNLAGASALVINGLAGNDTINISPSALFAGGISIFGGEPDGGSDAVIVAGTTPTVNFAANQVTGIVGGAISLEGIETLTVNGSDGVANAITVTGYGSVSDVKTLNLNAGDTNNNDGDTIDIQTTAGVDTINYTPLSASSGLLTRSEGGAAINVSGFNNADNSLSLDALGNIDTLNLVAPSGNDTITAIDGGLGSRLTVTANGSVKWVPIDFTSVNAVGVAGGAGNDTLNVDNSAGLLDFSSGITFDGQSGSDTLRLIGSTQITTSTYNVGPDVNSGSVVHSNGSTQTVYFKNLEPVVDLVVAANLVVNGTNADNAISYTQGSVAANGLVTVDGFETIEFSNKTALTINGLAGADTINLNNPNVPTGLTGGITVNGGEATSGDTLIVNGRAGLQDQLRLAPTGTGAGTITSLAPTQTFTGIENIKVVLQPGANDAFTVDGTAGNDHFRVTSGPQVGQNFITGEMNQNLGAFLLPSIEVTGNSTSLIGTFNFNGVGGTDTFTLTGTDVNDRFEISRSTATSGAIGHYVNGVLTNFIGVANLATLIVDGLNGDDTFNMPGNFPFALQVSGGNPSAGSDVVNYTAVAAGGLVTFDIGQQSITQAGNPSVSFTGVETVNIDATAEALTVNGTSLPDQITYTPTGPSAGTVRKSGFNTALNFTNVAGTFTIDTGAGSDHLIVNGTQSSETITVNSTTVSFSGGQKTVAYNGTNTEFLQINALAGNDVIDVTPSATTPIFVDGGDPIGNTPGDEIVLHPPGAFTIEPGPENDEGGLNPAGAQRVSWDHIEEVSIVGGGPGVFLGTNGDDDITIIARDSSTHAGTNGVQDFTVSLNDGPDILFIDTPVFLVDALAGDDDIVVREPAPNGAVWNVQLFVAGGTPASPTTDQGDTFQLETPNIIGTPNASQSIVYTPAPTAIPIPALPAGVTLTVPLPGGVDTALVNDTTNTSLMALTPFTLSIPALNFTYTSSPGGMEEVIYNGLGSPGGASDGITVVGTADNDVITYTAGSTRDSGKVQVGSLLPLLFQNIGTTNSVAITDGGGTDSLVYEGTGSNDTFGINATTGVITLTNPAGAHVNVTVPTAGSLIESLYVDAFDGDDVFNVTAGPLFAAGITLAGGNPSGSDIATLNGTAGNDVIGLTLDITGDTVTGVVGGPIVLVSTEVLNLNGLGGDDAITVNNVGGLSDIHNVLINSGGQALDTLVVNGTADDDVITYTPTGAATGNFSEAEGITQFAFTLGAATTSAFTINGGTGAVGDMVLVKATNGPDFITVDSPNRTASVENAAGTVLKPVILGATIEEITVEAGFGNDTALVIPSPATAVGPGGAAVNVPINLLINIDGGPPGASDALVVAQAGGVALPATDFAVISRSRTPDEGVVRVYRNAVAMPDITYKNVEIVSPVVFVNPADGDPNLLILGPDQYEQNEFRQTSAYLGSGSTLNLTNLSIFPNAVEHRFVAADNDWFRVVAQKTGTLDFQVYFRQFSQALLPGGGDLDIEVRDSSGDLITGFGGNDNNGDERVRIPAVAGQTYYVRVFGTPPGEGANLVVNGYSMTIVNEAPPVPFDIELDDVVGTGAALAGGAAGTFTASTTDAIPGQPGLNPNSGYYVGNDPKLVSFTSGNLAGQQRVVTTYTVVAGVATFTFATPFSAAPAAGSRFLVESVDTGRSQVDNVTHDNQPTIYLRLDDGIFLNDLPGNDTPDSPPDEVIPIPFSPNGLTPGYRIAIFDEGNTPPQTGTAPQTPVGFAEPVPGQQGVYSYKFTGGLTDGSHFITARVQMIDPATPMQTGFGGRSLSLEIVVDTGLPPVFFGNPGIDNDGLTVDPGVTPQPPTFIDRKTNDRTPTFWGTAEANTVVRLYADLTPDNGVDNFDVLLGLGVTLPYDGTNQFPFGQWTITSNIDLNDPTYFPVDGLRRILATAEDVAGNINPGNGVDAQALNIFLDTQGPQVTGLFITNTTLVALGTGNTLLRFDSASPTLIAATTPITGLQAGDVVVGIDRRPANGKLYIVVDGAATDRIYTVEPLTGVATLVSTLTVNLSGSSFGVDFNPQADRLRIVSDTDQNLRVNVDNGVVTVDGAINPASDLGGAAYTNNVAGATFTSLYTIDPVTDTLNLQNPPNGGTQVTVGALGINISGVLGFDIAPGTNIAFAALTQGGLTRLYTINLVTGAASLIDNIDDGDTVIAGLTALTPFDLFALKPQNALQGPTPPITSLSIGVRDLPTRVIDFLNPAVNPTVAINPGHYVLRGDHSGVIPIKSITFTPVPEMPGQIALGTITLEFFSPLPDDRFTLTMSDSIVDDVGNKLDGENNAIEPLAPFFPTGDGQPGGNFIARFTVDTRPEIGTYAAASIFIDINGNLVDDPEGQDNDYTNRDLRFTLGVTNNGALNSEGFNIHDGLFAGNFPSGLNGTPQSVVADGFDKLGAYGYINGHFRWLIDTNHDGVINPAQGDYFVIQPAVAGFNLSALPVIGRFNPDLQFDQIGLFDGTKFLLDTDGDFILEASDTLIVTSLRGAPIAGDFDGDGLDDLGTWKTDNFYFDFADDGFGSVDATIAFGFPGVAEQPVAADMDQDGLDDVGLFVPRRSGIVPEQLAEWYFLISNDFDGTARTTGTVSTLDHPFSPTPLGQDIYAQFGDEFALPIVGNFDPPPTSATPTTPTPRNMGVVYGQATVANQSFTGNDWYSFQTVRNATVSVSVPGAVGSQVVVYNEGMQPVGSGTVTSAGTAAVTSALPAATYFVRVTGSTTQGSIQVASRLSTLEQFDISRNGKIDPIDVLQMVDNLNRFGIRTLDFSGDVLDEVLYDTSLDGKITPLDTLALIDQLHRTLAGAASSGLLASFESSEAVAASLSTPADSAADAVFVPVISGESTAAVATSTSTIDAAPESKSAAVTATPTASSTTYSTRTASRGRTTSTLVDTALAEEEDWALFA